MDLPVTFPTESDEILFSVMAQSTSQHNVVNFQPSTRTFGSAIHRAVRR
jgi:hypothetical protein